MREEARGTHQRHYPANGNPLITSVTDTSGVLLESHSYDLASKRGLSSARAGGVDAITVSYPTSPVNTTSVTDSLANATSYGYGFAGGRGYVTGINGPGCASCGGAQQPELHLRPLRQPHLRHRRPGAHHHLHLRRGTATC